MTWSSVEPPRAILDAAGIEPTDVVLLTWRVPIWQVVRDGMTAILRTTPIDALFSVEDLRWQHRVQLLLVDRGVRVPVPIPVFDRDTAAVEKGCAWEVLTYLPGSPLAWQAQPTLHEVGALMALDGTPARVSGLIDFNNAYLETPLADVGVSLWQAGRPAQDDYTLDSRRVSDLVAGYVDQRRLPLSAAHEIATFIRARGIRLMVRSSMRRPRDLRLPLQLVDWVAHHQTSVAGFLSDTIGGGV